MKNTSIATLSLLLLVGLFGSNAHAGVFDHNTGLKTFDAHFVQFNGFQHDFHLDQRSFQQARQRNFVAFAHQGHFSAFAFAKSDFERSFDKDFSGRQNFVAHVTARDIEFADFGFQKAQFEDRFGSFGERFEV